jgi:Tfp pilus assembly protein PilF
MNRIIPNRIALLVSMLALLKLPSMAQDPDSKTSQETAKTFTRDGDYTNAIVVLNRALQKDPKNLDLLKDLSFDYYLQRDYAKGLDIARPLTERTDADVQCYQIAGLFYKAMDEGSACEKLYKTGIKRWPKSGVLYNEYGEVLFAKQDYSAIKQWEKGIETDPNYSSNYYNAAKYYFFTYDKVWSLVYGEIFLNLESYSKRTAEVKELLLEGYKKLFSDTDLSKNQDNKSAFAEAWLNVMTKLSPAIAKGVTAESLTVLRTEFIIKWFETYPANFPFRLFDYQRQLLNQGLFDAYNQWIFGAAENLPSFQTWINTHNEDYNRFTNFQKGRIFKLPEGQYYQPVSK